MTTPLPFRGRARPALISIPSPLVAGTTSSPDARRRNVRELGRPAMRSGHVPTAGCGSGVASWARPERIAGCRSDAPPSCPKAGTALIRADLLVAAATYGGDSGAFMKGVPHVRTVPDRMSTIVPLNPQYTHVRKGCNQVPANPDPDEEVLIDFAMVRSRMMRRFTSDGDFDPEEQEITADFDASFQIVSTRYQVRRSFESLMRNGLTKRTGDQARHAGIVVMVDNGQRVSNVIQLFPDEPQNAA